MVLLLQKRVSFEPTTTYLLKDLRPFTTYTFQLAARSRHGTGAYTNEISAETPQTRRSSSKLLSPPVKQKPSIFPSIHPRWFLSELLQSSKGPDKKKVWENGTVPEISSPYLMSRVKVPTQREILYGH